MTVDSCQLGEGGSGEFVSIEISKVGVFQDVQVLDGHYFLVNGGHGVVCRFYDEVLSVNQQTSSLCCEHFAALVQCRQDVPHLCLVEA